MTTSANAIKSPLPARRMQAPLVIPFAHIATTDADAGPVPIWQLPFDAIVDRCMYYNATGLAEHAANFAAFALQKALIVEDIVIASVDIAADTVTFAAAHTLETGDGPVRLTNSGGALPAGLAAGTDYWVVRVNDLTIAFSTTLNNSIAGTKINITGVGTGVHTLIDQAGTKRRLTLKSTNSAIGAGDDGIAAATWTALPLNRSQALVLPAGTALEFFADEEGTTNIPAGQGVVELRYLK